jgi:hypothetical protein
MANTPTKTTRRNDNTIRTVSRSMKTPEKVIRNPEKRSSTPQKSLTKSPEKSTLGRKFATTVMQPAFEQVISLRSRNLLIVTTTIEEISY